MRLEQLKYFIDVLSTNSITKTAQINYASPQAVSSALLKLEEEIDCSLLLRSTSGVSATPEGKLFLPYAQEIITAYTSACQKLSAYKNEDKILTGEIRICSSSIVSDIILPDVISYFAFQYPQVKVRITEVSSENIVAEILTQDYDIAFLSAIKEYTDQLVAEHSETQLKKKVLMEDIVVLCMNKNPHISAKSLDNDALRNNLQKEKLKYTFYNFVPSLQKEIRDMSLNGTVTTSNSPYLHKKLMLQGSSLCCMPYLAYQYQFQDEGFAYVTLEDAYPTEHTIIYKTSSLLVEKFVDYINYYCAKQPLFFGIVDEKGNLG